MATARSKWASALWSRPIIVSVQHSQATASSHSARWSSCAAAIELAGRLDVPGRVGYPAPGVGGQRPQRRDRHRDAGLAGIRAFRDEVQDRLRGADIPAHQALGHQPGPQRHRRR